MIGLCLPARRSVSFLIPSTTQHGMRSSANCQRIVRKSSFRLLWKPSPSFGMSWYRPCIPCTTAALLAGIDASTMYSRKLAPDCTDCKSRSQRQYHHQRQHKNRSQCHLKHSLPMSSRLLPKAPKKLPLAMIERKKAHDPADKWQRNLDAACPDAFCRGSV